MGAGVGLPSAVDVVDARGHAVEYALDRAAADSTHAGLGGRVVMCGLGYDGFSEIVKVFCSMPTIEVDAPDRG
jgi:hypothetical protein